MHLQWVNSKTSSCQLHSDVVWMNRKWRTFCVALFWKQIWGLMERWRAHSHAKAIDRQSSAFSLTVPERERENSIFSTCFQTAALRERLDYQSALLILSAGRRNLCCSRYWNTQSVRQIILNIIIIVIIVIFYYSSDCRSNSVSVRRASKHQKKLK